MNILKELSLSVLSYLKADWSILLIGILIAVSINVYIDSNNLRKFLERKSGVSIPGAVGIGALTPLCACGTMALLLSMFISAMPWGPVMAFLISSPLTSPSEYIFETSFFGSRFANGLLIASILLGLLGGLIAHLLDKKTNFFKNQLRLNSEGDKNNSCCDSIDNISENNSKVENTARDFIGKYKIKEFIQEFYNIGIKKILIYFIVFIAIGRIVELFIPREWIMSLFSGNKSYSIPLAATIGLPLYLSDASAIPLLKSFINAGAGEGAVLAFLIAGKATGVPVIAGISTFMKKRALIFYVIFVYVGAIVAGYLYQLVS